MCWVEARLLSIAITGSSGVTLKRAGAAALRYTRIARLIYNPEFPFNAPHYRRTL